MTSVAAATLPAPACTGTVSSGARGVGYTEFGPRDGAPIVFCTGAGMAGSMAFAGDALDAHGLRLICVDRAGLGLSEPDPDKSLASYANDVAAVLDGLHLDAAPVVAVSQGAPFATAFAATGRATALAIVSGQDELAHPRMRPLLHPDIASLIDAIAADRDGFEAAFAARVDADGLWGLVLGMSAPADRAFYEQPTFAAAYRDALHRSFAQGPAGYVRDLTLALSPWPFAPEAISVPVHLWYGRQDTSPVHSPDHGATLATRFPRATHHVLDDEGGALLWTRGAEILARLTSAAAPRR